MSVICQEVIAAMDKLAPRHLAATWDNVGLLVGTPFQAAERILVTLDVTPDLARQAAVDGVDLIITHHPLIFRPLSSIRTDQPLGAALTSLLKADIALFAAHTNLDSAPGGVNDCLAGALGLADLKPLRLEKLENFLKLAVFVPQDHADKVRAAVTAAGAGHIGAYSNCTFQAAGTGTFLPLAGTSPFIGRQGQLEQVAEIRLETILPEKLAPQVIQALLAAHPYEEVAYDLYPLANPGRECGLGRVGRLAAPVSLLSFADRLKIVLGVPGVRLSGPEQHPVQTVAVCGGSGGDLWPEALTAGADVFVTGDVSYHQARDAEQSGLAVIDAGHYATERPIVGAVAAYLRDCVVQAGWTVEIVLDNSTPDAFRIF